MNKTKLKKSFVVCATVSVAIFSVSPAFAKHVRARPRLTFSKPILLPGFDGGEPTLGVDPSGNGGVYVSAPQGNGVGLQGTTLPSSPTALPGGVGFWGSHDHGRSFPISGLWGSAAGGGDSDVQVGVDHTVYIADLEIAGNAICKSTDGGRTFVDAGVAGGACHDVPTSQVGFESDREWLTPAPNGDLYFTDHDFNGQLPRVFKSTDHARTFSPCGATAFDPTGAELQAFTPPTSGTQVSRPVVDSNGMISVEFATGAPTSSSQGADFDHLWVSETTNCGPASIFKTQLVYQSAGANLAQPFDGLARDGAGDLYVLASGHLNASKTTDNVWLFVRDVQSQTWSAPIRVNTANLTANMLPAIAAGARKGEVAIGWYGSSTSTDRSSSSNQWRYYIATSFDSGRHFTQAAASGVVHSGAQARALLDFSSLAVEPHTGCVMAAFAEDSTGTRHALFVRQTSGLYLR
ncbi:MAG: hypothetical protein ACYDCC_00440 [Actinomycetota bacterium]